MEPENILDEIAKEVSVCVKCKLHHSRKKAVPGEGPSDSEIMFIGEAPGFHENEQGRPFVGAAGKFLDSLLENIGMSKKDVYITNVVKCRPPGNRDPEQEEIDTCTSNYLERQIEIINPKVIVTLGRFSMGLYMSDVKISNVHGQARWINDRLVIPMYHPAAALHQPKLKEVIQKDFDTLPELVKQVKLRDNPQGNDPVNGDQDTSDNPSQLSLF